jgi:hypothetical protein
VPTPSSLTSPNKPPRFPSTSVFGSTAVKVRRCKLPL